MSNPSILGENKPICKFVTVLVKANANNLRKKSCEMSSTFSKEEEETEWEISALEIDEAISVQM